LKCQHCEKNVDLPFKCPFCSGYFCADHRLPENHSCPELWKVRTRGPPPVEKPLRAGGEGKPEPPEKESPISYPLRFRKPGWTSSTEALHLTVSALIVMAVGLSMRKFVTEWYSYFLREPEIFLTSAVVFLLIFVSHELAHKVAAKRYGLWAEFRMNLIGAALTLLSIAPTPIKIISPGAVMIAGAANKRMIGITALAGPFTSIIFASLLFAQHFITPSASLASAILDGAWIGVWLTLLNLIPFGIMDGAKVFWWNKTVWAAIFSASIVLLIAVSTYLPF
jgi:Zn-dependent protease